MPKQIRTKEKIHVNVGTIGHIDHGKTTLTAAILKVQATKGLAREKSYQDISKGGIVRDKSKTVTITGSHVQYQTDARSYAHIDCPGHADYIKNMISGAAQMDGAILLVSAPDGPMPQTREHILLARQVGVAHLVVFINKCDLVADQELIDLVELELREQLSAHGFAGDQVVVIRGSAMRALVSPENADDRRCIEQLLEAMDEAIPDPVRQSDCDLMMPIESVYHIEGRGAVVTGKIELGTIRPGDEIDIVGFNDQPIRDTVTQVESFSQVLDRASAGQSVGCLLRKTSRGSVERGQVLAAAGTMASHRQFEAEVYVLKKEEGGRHTPFFNGYAPQFFFQTTDVTGRTEVLDGVDMAIPGDGVHLSVELKKPIALTNGSRFAIREGGRTVGSGVVTKVVD